LFWIVPVRPQDGLEIHLDAGRASLRTNNLPVQDYFSIPNALFRFLTPASVDARVSFDIRWSGPLTNSGPVTSPTGSTGVLSMSHADMTWSARNSSGFRFESNPHGTTSVFGQLGHVSNGVFG
jgi:hypothetical protein